MSNWPFGDLRPLSYSVILADPPWRFENWSRKGEHKGAAAQYDCMALQDIAQLPVGHLAAPDATCIMWATFPMLREAVALMEAWGFTFKTGGAWAKQSCTGASWSFGTGYIYRGASELWLLGTIGKPRVRSRSIRNLIVAPVREHSRKPDQMHEDIERLYPGPYCELFARERRPGWDAWGNETDKFERKAA